MISRARFPSLAVLFACAAFAQTAADVPAERILPLSYVDMPPATQEMTNLLRVLPDMRDVSYDGARKAMVVRGTASQVALAEWLVLQLDKPAGGQAAQPGTAAYDFHPAAGDDAANTAVRVFYLANAASPAEVQEFMTALRAGADLARVVPFFSDKAIVVRGAPEQVEMAEWMLPQLDRPSKSERKTAAFEYHSPEGGHAALASAVRILYLNDTSTSPGVQELMMLLRSGAEVQRAFSFTRQQALLIRAEPERVALAEWFTEQVDLPAEPGRKPASFEFHSPDSGPAALETAARVYFPAHIPPEAARKLVMALRTTAGLQRVFDLQRPWSAGLPRHARARGSGRETDRGRG